MIGGGPRRYGENENLTLSDSDLRRIGEPKRSGQWLRAFCPVHGSDHQRSLSVNTQTGYFKCHSCGCWGYTDWSREEYARERGLAKEAFSGLARARPTVLSPPTRPEPKPVEPVREDLDALADKLAAALPGSWGEKYLEHRGIPIELARAQGVGYARPGGWPGRKWKGGRLTVPHTRPDGKIVSFYGRAVARGDVPKGLKHDHLKGNKGYFNARALVEGEGPLYVVEGLLDALALIASGCGRVVAIFAARDWRWRWLPDDVREIVFALDADETGVSECEDLCAAARLRGIRVSYLDGENYGGEKDPAAAFAAGKLVIGEFPEPGPDDRDEADERQRRKAQDEEKKRRRSEAEAMLDRAREEAELDAAVGPAPDPERRVPNRMGDAARADARAVESRGVLTVEGALVEIRREGSGPWKALSHYRKSGGEKSFEYLVRAVLHARGLESSGWPGHASTVRAAVGRLDPASDTKVVPLRSPRAKGEGPTREELDRAVAAGPADIPEDPRERLRRNVKRQERGGP